MSRVETKLNPIPRTSRAKGHSWNFQDTAVKKIYGANGQLVQKVVLLRQKRCKGLCSAHANGNCCKGNQCSKFHLFVNEPWCDIWKHQDVVKSSLRRSVFDDLTALTIMEFTFALPKEPTAGDTLVKRV